MSLSKSSIIILMIGLLIGSIEGYIAAFVTYQPWKNEFVSQVDTLKSLISSTNSSLIEAESMILSLRPQVTDLQSQILDVETRADALKSLLSSSNAGMIEVESTISNLETQIADLQLQISEMPEVFVINDQEYYNSIKHDIENANGKILVAMYT